MDEEMKRFLQEELKKEADQIMREVEADPEVADLTAPSEIDQKLYEQIKQYKEEHYAPEETLSGEQQELIRLGKIYKRKQRGASMWCWPQQLCQRLRWGLQVLEDRRGYFINLIGT